MSEYYVIEAKGDGAVCKIVTFGQLHDEVHKLLCVCGANWAKCETDDVREQVKRLDDADNWSRYSPTYEDHSWELDCEDDSRVRVTRLTEPLPQPPKTAVLGEKEKS